MQRAIILLSSILFACGPTVATDHGDTSSGAGDDGSPGPSSDPDTSATITSADSTSATTVATSSTSADTDTGVDPTTEGAEGNPFIGRFDVDRVIECDLWIDDCPRGMKCMPWADDGGSSWNAMKCSILADDPHQVGEPCTVEGNGVSGIDDCAAHSMCWDVDPETNMGECVAFCTGSEASPGCQDPCSQCHIPGNGILILCLPVCDPLLPDCTPGQACYPTDDSFSCIFDASGDMGALGDSCDFTNVCDPGLFCASADSVPNCAGANGCCTLFCDVAIADPCVAVGDGVECIPWFEEGEAPPCISATIGACLLPA